MENFDQRSGKIGEGASVRSRGLLLGSYLLPVRGKNPGTRKRTKATPPGSREKTKAGRGGVENRETHSRWVLGRRTGTRGNSGARRSMKRELQRKGGGRAGGRTGERQRGAITHGRPDESGKRARRAVGGPDGSVEQGALEGLGPPKRSERGCWFGRMFTSRGRALSNADKGGETGGGGGKERATV